MTLVDIMGQRVTSLGSVSITLTGQIISILVFVSKVMNEYFSLC